MIKQMKLFQRNGWWYIKYSRTQKESLKTKNKLTAQREYNKKLTKLRQGKISILHDSIPFSEFRPDLEAHIKATKSKSYSTSMKYSLDHFEDFIGDKDIAKLTKQDMARFVQHMLSLKTSEKSKSKGATYSKSSINIDIRNLKAALSVAVEWELVQKNPWDKYKQLDIDDKRTAVLKHENIPDVSDSIDNPIIKRAFFFYVLTGCRRTEIVTLKWQQIDLKNNTIYFEHLKGHLCKTIPINNHLRELIEEIPKENRVGWVFPSSRKKGKHLHPDSMSKAVKRHLVKSGQGHLTLHGLRHTFATLLATKGATLKEVADLLGHTDTRTTERYYVHLPKEHLENVVNMLDIKTGGKK